MSIESSLVRVTPGVATREERMAAFGDAVARPWLIVLSEWLAPEARPRLSPHPVEQVLVQCVRSVFEHRPTHGPLPTVLVVDNIARSAAEHRLFLAELTEVGAVLLEARQDTEIEAIRSDPLGSAIQQLALAMQAAPLAGVASPAPAPTRRCPCPPA
jgi:hypothetical protein